MRDGFSKNFLPVSSNRAQLEPLRALCEWLTLSLILLFVFLDFFTSFLFLAHHHLFLRPATRSERRFTQMAVPWLPSHENLIKKKSNQNRAATFPAVVKLSLTGHCRQDGGGRDPGAGPLCRLLLEPGAAGSGRDRPRLGLCARCCQRAACDAWRGRGGRSGDCDAGAGAAQASSVSKARRVVLAGAVLLALGAVAAVAIIGGEAVKTGQVRMELSDRNEFEGAQSVWYCVCAIYCCVCARVARALMACSTSSVRSGARGRLMKAPSEGLLLVVEGTAASR